VNSRLCVQILLATLFFMRIAITQRFDLIFREDRREKGECFGEETIVSGKRQVFRGKGRCFGDQNKIKLLRGSVVTFMAFPCKKWPSEVLREIRELTQSRK
jgi:hypothetical protein